MEFRVKPSGWKKDAWKEMVQRIEDDIVLVLARVNGSMTEEQLFKKSELKKTTSFYGWRYAINNLENKKLIKDVSKYYDRFPYYDLTKKGCKRYIELH